MNFCTNCGNKLTNGKFCANCGSKAPSTKSNSIDNSVNYLKDNIKSVNNEFKESVVIDNIKNKTIPLIGNLIIDFFAIISIIVIVAQIVSYFAYDNTIPIKQSYLTYISNSSNISIASFLGEILVTTILPFLFMIVSGLRKKWMLILAVILLFVLGAIYEIDNSDSQDSSNYEILKNATVISNDEMMRPEYDTISSTTSEVYYVDENKILRINNEGKFNYLDKSYKYNIKSDGDNNGQFEIIVKLENKIIFSERVTEGGIIFSHKFIDKYIFFVCPVSSMGTSESHTTKYYAFDIDKLQLNVLNYYCPNVTFDECVFEEIETIKNNRDLYEFYTNTIVIPQPNETYYEKYYD